MYGEMVTELVRYRGLMAMLAWRDIRVRYKQSLVGFAWAFLLPLIQTLIMFGIFTGSGMAARIDDKLEGVPYLVFIMSGMVPWTFFAAALSSSIESLSRNSRLVTKIYFPREVFPLGSVTASMVDFGIGMLMFGGFYAYYIIFQGRDFLSAHVLLFPLLVLVQVMLLAGLALILSMANLFFRDVRYLMTFVIQLWFFATNVMYPLRFDSHPNLKWMLNLNPLIPIFQGYRDVLFHGRISQPRELLASAVVALVILLVGWRAFHKSEFKFAEYI